MPAATGDNETYSIEHLKPNQLLEILMGLKNNHFTVRALQGSFYCQATTSNLSPGRLSRGQRRSPRHQHRGPVDPDGHHLGRVRLRRREAAGHLPQGQQDRAVDRQDDQHALAPLGRKDPAHVEVFASALALKSSLFGSKSI